MWPDGLEERQDDQNWGVNLPETKVLYSYKDTTKSDTATVPWYATG